MQPFTQKYTIIQLFEDVAKGTRFAANSWPLHATIVDTFAIDWDVPTMVKKLGGLLADRQPATSVAEKDTFFGPEKQTHVVLLRKTNGLMQLHNDVVALLEQGRLRLNDPQFARKGFLPHATVQKHARLHKGDTAAFNALTLIDMFPDGDGHQRRVLTTVRLGS